MLTHMEPAMCSPAAVFRYGRDEQLDGDCRGVGGASIRRGARACSDAETR